MSELDRRGFLRVVGASALAAALVELTAGGRLVEIALAQDGASPSPVAVVGLPPTPDRAEIEKRLKEAIDASGGLSWLKPNQTVAIKIVSNSGRPYPFTTHPIALQALIHIIKEAQPTTRVIVADQPGTEWVAPTFGSDTVGAGVREIWSKIHSGTASGHDVLAMNGLLAAAQEAGAEVRTFDREEDWTRVGPTAHWPKGFRIPKLYGEVDHVVNIVRPAGHVMAGHTGAIKSWYGWLHPDDRIASHTDMTFVKGDGPLGLPRLEVAHLHECIAEVAATFAPKTRLNILAAIGSYSDIGPDWGKQPLEQSMIAASKDMAAVDAVSAALVAYEKHRVPESERKKTWEQRPWYRRWWQPWKDEAFWGSIEGSFHKTHGTQAFDDLVAHPRPGGVYTLRQNERAREIGLGPAGGVKLEVAPDAPIAGDVATALASMTANTTGINRAVEKGGK